MRAVSTAASVVRHSVGALGEALLIVIVIAALLFGVAVVTGSAPGGAASALAGRGTISVPDGSFGGSTTATVNPGGDAWVRGRCYQDGRLVYEEYVRVNESKQATLTLGPTENWTSGAATCTGEELSLGNNERWKVLASTSFSVGG